MKRAVVTGASGVVGSALIEELLDHNYEVTALLREGSSHNARIPDHPALIKTECSLEHLKDFPGDKRQRDVFFHLGWTGTKGLDRNNPYIHTKNIEYALDAVSLAARLNCELFIGAGSQGEYGRPGVMLTPETLPQPESAYGIAKLAAGHMTREYAHTLGLKHIWTRILSVYGKNDGEKTLMTSFLGSLLKGESPLCTKGEQIWDLLYQKDAARALRLIAGNGRDGAVYLIGSGGARPLKEMLEEIRDTVAPDVPINFGAVPYGPGQVMYLAADISATCRDTGWKPLYSLREGILDLIGSTTCQNDSLSE